MDIENWRKAGRIAAEVLEYGKSIIKKDKYLLDVAEKIEKRIFDLGAKPAFPVNISFNETAAHDTPAFDDKRTFQDDLVKLDVGILYNGAIGDTALTIDLTNSNKDLIRAAEDALKNAIKIIRPEISLREIGKEIMTTISEYGFFPIRNLSGHGLKEYNFHAEPTIPNYDNGDEKKLTKGQIIAIEPFATTGAGIVTESGNAQIFQLLNKKPLRDMTARQILNKIESYQGLPFCLRWLKFPPLRLNLSIREMERLDMLRKFAPLADKNSGLVAQAEHSVYVDDEAIVLTKS